MDKNIMASLISHVCFKSKDDDNDPLYAVQLFIEDLVLPSEIDSYTVEEMEQYILNFLNKQ